MRSCAQQALEPQCYYAPQKSDLKHTNALDHRYTLRHATQHSKDVQYERADAQKDTPNPGTKQC